MPTHIAPEVIINGTLYTLLAFSVATWTVILFKLWEFTNNGYRNRRFNAAFWDAADLTQAESVPVDTAIGPQARIAQQGFAWLSESQHAAGKHLRYIGAPDELLEHSLQIQMQKEQHLMESGLTLLASIGSTSPFVGLFGTVLGIMHAMHEITASGSTSLDVVAGPIGDALVATAIGIAVAVPAVLAYNFFLRRVKQQRAGLENFVTSFLHIALSQAKA